MLRIAAFAALLLPLVAKATRAQEWQPVPGKLQTRWAKDVSPFTAWPEHPRPLLRRTTWRSQNGLWDYAITGATEPMPEQRDGEILVPFPLESSLSGVARSLRPDQRLWYRRTLQLPDKGDRFLLHFGAVDHACEVFVDGNRVGEHAGGFDPFTLEITTALGRGRGREHTLLVAVRDPSDTGPQPRGKQVQKPGGIWYTPCSGIWQTVWIEGVPETYVQELTVAGDRTTGKVRIDVHVDGPTEGLHCTARVFDLARVVAEVTVPLGQPIELVLSEPRAWSPRDPFRHGLQIRTFRGESEADSHGGGDWVDSYFALRDVAIGSDDRGTTRILLNGEPLFSFGPLDQGYWPDGIYTPPTLAAMCSDLDAIQQMGCNMLRKHVKVECERFYEECDKRGILVWQDMPSGDCQNDPATFEKELRALIDARRRHPSIVMWVVFNEGWGQHDTERYVDLVKRLDPTRLVSNASGWTDQRCGDVIDLHVYPGPGMLPPEPRRASVLGEYGGLGLPLQGHTWIDKDNWGYVSFQDQRALTDAYVERLQQLRPRIAQGLCAAVYTQTTDVEVECNGWLTYDRAVMKIDVARAAATTRALYGPPGTLRTIVATAQDGPQTWRHVTEAPPDGWQRPDFDDSAWRLGPGGFGTKGTPGARIGTEWNTPSIWLRRTIELPDAPMHEPLWCAHHDEDVEVFVDGDPVFARGGYTTAYEFASVSATARALLRPGKHVLAVHCKQTGGGQFVDVGLSDLLPAEFADSKSVRRTDGR